MRNKPDRLKPTKQSQDPAADKSDDFNDTSQVNYKNITWFNKESNGNNNRSKKNKDCQCPFKCCTCEVIGNDLIKSQYTNSNDVLIEDDSKLIFVPM